MDKSTDFTVCFTGHRPKGIFSHKPYDEVRRKDYQAIVDKLAELIGKLIQQGYTQFITGGAQGFDQLAFWAVHKAKIAYNYKYNGNDIVNVVFIPFVGQERKWAKTGLFSQNEYNQMLGYADEIKVCTENIDTGNFPQVTKALMYRNKCMVNDSSYVLGQFADDSWQNYTTKSGTADCLRYARKMGRKIRLFNGAM